MQTYANEFLLIASKFRSIAERIAAGQTIPAADLNEAWERVEAMREASDEFIEE